MTAGSYDITIEQGADLDLTITWKDQSGNPVNLTGWSAALQMCEQITNPKTFLSLSSPANGITLGGTAGTIVLSVAASVTAAIVQEAGVYDLKMSPPDGTIDRLLEGAVYILSAVTQ